MYLDPKRKAGCKGDIDIYSSTSTTWRMDDFHYHEGYEIYYSMHNDIRFITPETVYNLKPDQILIFRSNELHMSLLPENFEYKRKIIQFKPGILTGFFDEGLKQLDKTLTADKGNNRILQLSYSESIEFSTIVDKMFYLYIMKAGLDRVRNAEEYYDLETYLKIYLAEILLMLNRGYRALSNDKNSGFYKNNDKLAPILNFIHDNYYMEINHEIISKKFFLSKSHLIYLFKKSTGITPREYIIRWRISKACELLQASSLSITEISLKVGFNDTPHFIRTFKRITGKTPGKYLEK